MPNINIVYLDEVDVSIPGDAQVWNKIFDEPPPLFDVEDQAVSPGLYLPVFPAANIGSTFDLFEALRLEPMDGEITPKQGAPQPLDTPGEDWSENVERLIRETDAAFKAVGFALADAKTATDLTAQHYAEDNTRPTPVPKTPTRTVLRKQHKPALSRNASVTKPKRKHNHGQRAPRLVSGGQRDVSIRKETSRWTLNDATDNVSNIFGLKTIEADEISTSTRVSGQGTQTVSEFAAKRKSSLASRGMQIDDILTPIEPFHLQDLPGRILAASSPPGNVASPTSSAIHRPLILSQRKRRSRALQKTRLTGEDYLQIEIEGGEDDKFLDVQGLLFPLPPMPNSTPPRSSPNPAGQRVRSATLRRVTIELPTIEEVSPITPNSSTGRAVGSRSSASSGSSHFKKDNAPALITNGRTPTPMHTSPVLTARPRSPDLTTISASFVSEIELPSTPYTLTSPLFRHGSIRLLHQSRIPYTDPLRSGLEASGDAPSQMRRSGRSGTIGSMSNEQAVDWSFFQVAISSGAGSALQEGGGFRLTTFPEIDMDEFEAWWTSFGIGIGRFIGAEEGESSRKRLARMKSRSTMRKNVGPADGGLLVDGETLVRQWEQARLNESAGKKAQRGRTHMSQESGVIGNFKWGNNSLPPSLRIGHIATPVREAAYRRANWGGIERGSEIDRLGLQAEALNILPAWPEDDDLDSDSSGPPSPMLEFVPKPGRESTAVPMGFNLNHDIGDYLKWENANVEKRPGS